MASQELPSIFPNDPDQSNQSTKEPQVVFDSIFAFPPNRDTLGGTAFLILENNANILVDCPAWTPLNQAFLQRHGGVKWLVITHRDGLGKAAQIQQAWDCPVLVQEQEAYLLPCLKTQGFKDEVTLSSRTQMIWTPGYSPGSACLYYATKGGILFTGRHLLPNPQGQPMPLRTAKTFHWPRQLQSVQTLIQRFSPETLSFICPGANTGFLRGRRQIDNAYKQLCQLDLAALRQMPPGF